MNYSIEFSYKYQIIPEITSIILFYLNLYLIPLELLVEHMRKRNAWDELKIGQIKYKKLMKYRNDKLQIILTIIFMTSSMILSQCRFNVFKYLIWIFFLSLGQIYLIHIYQFLLFKYVYFCFLLPDICPVLTWRSFSFFQ